METRKERSDKKKAEKDRGNIKKERESSYDKEMNGKRG